MITLAAGLIIKSAGWTNSRNFDYSKTDAEFEKQLSSSFVSLEMSQKKQEKVNLLKEYSDSMLFEKENNTTLKNGEIPLKRININLALSADLQMLPGVGEITAEKIIEYREANNGFSSIEELMQVKGIGIKKFEKIKNLVTLN